MTSRRIVHAVAAFVASVGAAACGSGTLDVGYPTGGSGGGGGASIGSPAAYVGVLADSLKKGSVTISVSSTLSVTGTLTFAGGPTVSITGAVDTAAQEIHATGSGYTINGFVQSGQLSAVYGNSVTSGYIVATADSLTGETHKTYCGLYSSTNSNGRVAMQVLSGGAAAGFFIQSAGTSESSFFNGTVVGNSVLTSVSQQGVPISGTMSSDQSTITGTYAPPVSGSTGTSTATGTFSVSVNGC